ncbi:MAG: glycine cleavage system protein GcvH [Candidatus Thermoplasmatota archaeon]|jgi:glycine cleavage system H protein|nr:glycine cleavage system protein GcvH [Candidatus Thermoplasmatota archaeon]MCL5681252.1 glycine cleavage system protein GcvH [Candidatus Thermoplasmatota archaeon]
MIVKDGLYYTKTHEWIRLEGDVASVGITDFAQNQLTDIVYVDLPKVGAMIKAGEIAGTVESVKSAEDFYSPITGKVLEVNKDLEKSPELINKDAYQAWMYKMKISNPSEVSSLMKKDDYEKLIKK